MIHTTLFNLVKYYKWKFSSSGNNIDIFIGIETAYKYIWNTQIILNIFTVKYTYLKLFIRIYFIEVNSYYLLHTDSYQKYFT